MTISADLKAGSGTSAPGAGLHVECWGDGDRVVLVHGSLAVGTEEWEAQRPLAEQGFRLVVLDRRGHGGSPPVTGEDYLADADDVAELLADGAHLVGHSYGGIAAMIAAARRPEVTRSLTLLEAPATVPDVHQPAWTAFVEEATELWHRDLDDEEWVVRFLTAVGTDPAQLPPELLADAVRLVPVFRQGRPFFTAELPLAELAAAPFPTLVVSGGHHAGFEEMCDALAARIRASRAVVEGAGHEIQFTGPPVNDLLAALWRGSS